LDKIWSGESRHRFAEHLVKIFIRNAREMVSGEEQAVFVRRESTQSQATETTRLTKGEVRAAISKHLNAKTASGYDLIMGRILKKLPELGFGNYLTHLFNTILRADYFPPQGKVAQIIMIPKPNRDPVDVRSATTDQSAHCLSYRKYSRNFSSPKSNY